jgi:DNA-binding transcriptional regulator WhiA
VSKRQYGNRCLGISLNIKDKNHLQKLNCCLDSNVSIKEYKETIGFAKGNKYCRVIYTSEKLTNDLINNGVYEKKTNIIAPPNLKSDNLIREFIRGYFDGDGSIWKQDNKTQVNISFVGTDNLLQFIMQYLLDNNAIIRKYSLNKRKPQQIVSNFKFGGNCNSFRFLDFIYKDANMYLDRKYQMYLELKEYINSHPIQ